MHSQTFATRDEALQYEATLSQGVVVDPRGGLRLFGEMAETWRDLQPQKAESTRRRDETLLDRHVLPVFGETRIGYIQPSDIERWVNHLDLAPDTATKALRILRTVFEIARCDGLIPVNPAVDVKPPKARRSSPARALDDAEVTALVAASDDVDPATAPIVWLMARCGLRFGEALALQRHDLDLDSGLLRVERSLSRHEGVRPLKSRQQGESRTIPLPADVVTRLRQHPVPLLPGGWLFPTSTGNAMSDSNWRKRTWRRIKASSGVECRPHDLRHTVATRLFTVARWTPGEVQCYMGHLDPRVTLAIYTHITTEDLPAPPAMATLVADATG
jgi:integrase